MLEHFEHIKMYFWEKMKMHKNKIFFNMFLKIRLPRKSMIQKCLTMFWKTRIHFCQNCFGDCGSEFQIPHNYFENTTEGFKTFKIKNSIFNLPINNFKNQNEFENYGILICRILKCFWNSGNRTWSPTSTLSWRAWAKMATDTRSKGCTGRVATTT